MYICTYDASLAKPAGAGVAAVLLRKNIAPCKPLRDQHISFRKNKGSVIDTVALFRHASTVQAAECIAAQEGLKLALKHNITRLIMAGDCLAIIDAVASVSRPKACNQEFAEQVDLLKSLVKEFKHVRFEWIPREMNGRADRASRRILYRVAPKTLPPEGVNWW